MADKQDLIFSSDDEGNNEPKDNKNLSKKDAKGVTAQRALNVRSTGFKEFLLRPELMKGIGDAGFEHPSGVQQEAIPIAIYGKDLICQAKSGMGKTAVFVLSVLHQLDVEADPFQCLVICHTRELAHQISREFERLGKYIVGLRIQSIYGGVNIDKQILKFEAMPPHIVIGTPGRTLDLVQKNKLPLDKLRFFVVDECDKVLQQVDMRETVQNIFVKTRPKKQVCMFTATLSEKTKDICLKFLKQVNLTSRSTRFTSQINRNSPSTGFTNSTSNSKKKERLSS